MIQGWKGLPFEQEYMQQLKAYLGNLRKMTTIYPSPDKTFDALKRTPLDKVKVVIIGQDPYHNGQAVGRSFAVEQGSLPPSLVRILRASQSENKGDLISWTEQGVLLLNTILTVEKGKPLSHKGIGWEYFTRSVIDRINSKEDPVVFLLWGAQAKTLQTKIRHNIIYAEHPVAGVYSGRPWDFQDCFNRTNELLQTKIHW